MFVLSNGTPFGRFGVFVFVVICPWCIALLFTYGNTRASYMILIGVFLSSYLNISANICFLIRITEVRSEYISKAGIYCVSYLNSNYVEIHISGVEFLTIFMLYGTTITICQRFENAKETR